MKTTWLRRSGRGVWPALCIYFILVLLLMFFENRLIYPAPRYAAGDLNAAASGAVDVSFVSADGTKLHGWYFDRPKPRGHLLFCYGNGEQVAFLGDFLGELSLRYNLAIFTFDYRGYGRSEGSPNEAGILADAAAAQTWLATRGNLRPNQVLIMGRSLGGGVAVDLAAKNGARGLILWSTFSSLPDAAAVHYPWVPVRWLMRNRYDSISKIGKYTGPLLQFHGDADEIVPIELGKKLFEASASEQKQFVTISNGTHNDMPTKRWYDSVDEFIRGPLMDVNH